MITWIAIVVALLTAMIAHMRIDGLLRRIELLERKDGAR